MKMLLKTAKPQDFLIRKTKGLCVVGVADMIWFGEPSLPLCQLLWEIRLLPHPKTIFLIHLLSSPPSVLQKSFNSEAMKIFKTHLMTDAEPGHLLNCDTILWDGKYWLVPTWLVDKATKKIQPERIILLDNLEHQITPPGEDHDFFLDKAIPKDVYSGLLPAQTIYCVIMQPEILFDSQEFS